VTTRSTTARVHAQQEGGVGWILLDNPQRRNAISTSMMVELERCLADLDDDPAARVIVIRGAGGEAFAAGADISEFESQQTVESARERSDTAVAAVFATLERLSTPVIAMIHGHCLGAGLAVALACDLRYCSPGARFAIPAAKLGIGYPVALTHALVDVVGPGRAAEILYAGRPFDAGEARTARLVNAVISAEELEDHVRRIAGEIAQNAPLSVRAARSAIKARGNAALIGRAEEHVAACKDSLDAREGQRAFMERRAPIFTGR
jgi:enoyl-CoA hydratase